jgi:hypothetical protein
MKFYLLQNIFGIFNNICCIVVLIINNGDLKDIQKLVRVIKVYSFDIIRCIFDCLIALYYWKKIFSAKIAGIIGVISSIMAIIQTLEKI